ncbi:hypothetical protein BJV77DRAFT_982834 [Russula vinacea]|nr:hypothetical protein BJV77DRAFT_982834 [Russula vinacea]
MDHADTRTKDLIVASDMADRIVRMLAPDANGTMLLPRLRRLELDNCQRLSGRAIVEAVRERARPPDDITEGGAVDAFPLEDVAVVRCANFTAADASELAEVPGE